jgi:hypothetical protein
VQRQRLAGAGQVERWRAWMPGYAVRSQLVIVWPLACFV